MLPFADAEKEEEDARKDRERVSAWRERHRQRLVEGKEEIEKEKMRGSAGVGGCSLFFLLFVLHSLSLSDVCFYLCMCAFLFLLLVGISRCDCVSLVYV